MAASPHENEPFASRPPELIPEAVVHREFRELASVSYLATVNLNPNGPAYEHAVDLLQKWWDRLDARERDDFPDEEGAYQRQIDESRHHITIFTEYKQTVGLLSRNPGTADNRIQQVTKHFLERWGQTTARCILIGEMHDTWQTEWDWQYGDDEAGYI